MSRSGPVGGAATLSSFRVQKAFSINFRENKRLHAEMRLIENEYLRNIRHVKQEIKDTRMWLEKIRESSGKCHLGLRPDTEPGQKRKKVKPAPPKSRTVVSQQQIDDPRMEESDVSDDDEFTKISEQDPVINVRLEGTGKENSEVKVRPRTEAAVSETEKLHRAELKSEPVVPRHGVKSDFTQLRNENDKPGEKKNERVPSATSVRSSLVSLNVYQRRNKLQTMIAKKQNPLEYKRAMNASDTRRVNTKVIRYLDSLVERMDISMPDLTRWRPEAELRDASLVLDAIVP